MGVPIVNFVPQWHGRCARIPPACIYIYPCLIYGQLHVHLPHCTPETDFSLTFSAPRGCICVFQRVARCSTV